MKTILNFFLSFFRRKELIGDFSSFDHACPVRDCEWYFQNEEMRQEHIKAGKHGDDIELGQLPK